jgi:dTMP kinase
VITDRYFDSSIAYQGAGRVLSPGEVARISRWATESLFPTLTIVIDLPVETSLARLKSRDRLESEANDFHERVRQEFLQIARLDPERYYIVDGKQSIEKIHKAVVNRVGEIPTLMRNQKDEHGNRLLKPVRRARKAVKDQVAKTKKKTQKKSVKK